MISLAVLLLTALPLVAGASPIETRSLAGLARSQILQRLTGNSVSTPLPSADRRDGRLVASASSLTIPGQWSSEFGIAGLDGTPSCAIKYQGDLVVGGNFASADGRTVNFIARWNGHSWNAMGEGFDSPVEALAIWQGRLVAGGVFVGSGGQFTGPLAVWNGIGWDALGRNLDGMVDALATNDSSLVVGGVFTANDSGRTHNIALWNGTTWDAVGGGTDGPVLAITRYNGEWVAGGYFGAAGDSSAQCIARWNGSVWRGLGEGISVPYNEPMVLALASVGPELIAGGQFLTAGTVSAGGVARWNGREWSALPLSPNSMLVTALAPDAGVVHIGGFCNEPDPPGNPYLALWDGRFFSRESTGPDSPPFSIVVDSRRLVIAGSFQRVDDRLAPHVAVRSDGHWAQVEEWHSPLRGLLGYVHDMALFEGRPVAVGEFDFGAADTGWVALHGAAVWKDNAWHPMGNLGASGAGSLLLANDTLYVANGLVKRWDGRNWVTVGDPVFTITHLAFYQGSLWGAAQCSGACGDYTGLYRLAGTHWLPVQPPAGVPADSAVVSALLVKDGQLIVAWAWGRNWWEPHTILSRFDGTSWGTPLGSFDGGQIQHLGVFRDRLFANGGFQSVDGHSANGFAMLDSLGWDDHHSPSLLFGGFAATDSLLFLGGLGVVAFDGNQWDYLGLTMGGSTSLLLADRSIWVGGAFRSVSGLPSSCVARFDLPAPARPPGQFAGSVAAAPNPSRGDVTLGFTLGRAARVRVSILDASGRKVAVAFDAPLPAGKQVVTWNARLSNQTELRPGLYFATVELDGIRSTWCRLVRFR